MSNWWFPTIRHNELRDFTASLLSEVCHGVSVEPHLQPLTGETFPLASAIVEDGTTLDVAANDFWGSHHQVFIDVKMFNPNALSPVYLHYIVDWKRRSGGSMSSNFMMWRWDVLPLWCFQLSGYVYYKRLASLLADKRDVSYSVVMSWLRCRVSFFPVAFSY